MKEIEVYVSSVTGNTRKLSKALIDGLDAMGIIPRVFPTEEVLGELRRMEGLDGARQIQGADELRQVQDASELRQIQGASELRRIQGEKASADSPDEDPPVILCFWCRKAGLDDLSLRLVGHFSGRKIMAFGTMGSYPDSHYGDQVRENVSRVISERNQLLGLFLCRGKIDEERTRRRRRLPEGHPHYLTEEAYKRHLSSRTHPDERDLNEAVLFLKKIMEEDGL